METKNPDLDQRDFSEAQYNASKWVSYLSPVEMGKIAQTLGDYQKTDVLPFINFVKLTGPLPSEEAERNKVLDLLMPIIKTTRHGYFMGLLSSIKKFVQVENLLESYRAGNISPQLVEILDSCPENNETVSMPFIGERIQKVYRMIHERQIDFEPFRHEDDTGDDWFDKYRIDLRPLPYIAVPLSKLGENLEDEKKSTIAYLRAQVKLCLEEEKKANAVDFSSPLPGKTALENFALAIDVQYRERQSKRTRRDYSSPFRDPADIGFYVNTETQKIYDMRPYSEELHALFSVKSWRYLKDCAAAIREEIADFTGAALVKKKKENAVPSVFESEYAAMYNFTMINNLFKIITTNSGRQNKNTGIKTITTMEKGKKSQRTKMFECKSISFMQDFMTGEWVYRDKSGVELRMPVKYGTKIDESGHEVQGDILPPVLTTMTWKVLMFILILFTKEPGALTISTTVEEFLKATETPDTPQNRKTAQKILKQETVTLTEITLQCEKGKYRFSQQELFSGIEMDRGRISITLAPKFAAFLSQITHFLMQINLRLLKIKSKNPSVLPLGFALNYHYGLYSNIESKTNNILKVETCLKNCPGIPSIEDVKRTRTSPEKRIIDAFEAVLNILTEGGVLEKWEYCLSKKEILKKADVGDYDYFSKIYITFEIAKFPIEDMLARIEEKREQRKKKNERVERLIESNIAKAKANAIMEAGAKKEEPTKTPEQVSA